MASIKDLLLALRKEYFGGASVRFEGGTPKVVSVGTTSTEILPGNPNRVGWAIVNKGSTPGHVDYSNKVATNRGFPVAQNGGTVASKYTDIDGGETVQSSLFALCETAAGDFYVVAWEIYSPEG